MKRFLLALLLALLPLAAHAADQPETAFARVMRTNTIRCAYWSMQPLSYKDPNSGELKGFAIKLFEDLASRLSLKVDWVEEVNFATMMAGLDANRYDAICSGAWLSADRARVMEYTWPYLYSSVMTIVRADDHRFDGDLVSINNKEVRVSMQDNLSARLANQIFPLAQKVQLPDMADPSMAFLDAATGKVDVVLSDAGDFQHYNQNNPGKLRMIHTDSPLQVYPWVIPVRKGEHDLASMINGALAEMIYNGDIQRITAANGVPTGTYFYVKPSIELK